MKSVVVDCSTTEEPMEIPAKFVWDGSDWLYPWGRAALCLSCASLSRS